VPHYYVEDRTIDLASHVYSFKAYWAEHNPNDNICDPSVENCLKEGFDDSKWDPAYKGYTDDVYECGVYMPIDDLWEKVGTFDFENLANPAVKESSDWTTNSMYDY